MAVPELETSMGLEVYTTKSLGIGGNIRRNAQDFVVEEVLIDGSKALVDSSGMHSCHAVLHASAREDRYLLAVLVKQNWSTLSAMQAIANRLDVTLDRIQAGGMKDARATTAQHLTIEGVSPVALQKIHVKDLSVHSIGYVRNSLSSYYLLGNSFRIIIRNTGKHRAIVEKRVNRILEELRNIGGIPNFFGHQRFGTVRPITHLVGKMLIQGEFKKAIMIFLAKASSYEHPDSRSARKTLLETGDFERALKDFPQQLRYERLILRHLISHPSDFLGALCRLPTKLQELFPQAYQSFLYNLFLSRRIKKGLPLNSVELGDYVVRVERSGLSFPKIWKKVTLAEFSEIKRQVKAGKLRLALPLPGHAQALSGGLQENIEQSVLDEEGMSLARFKKPVVQTMSARGGLRAALAPLSEFSFDASRDSPENGVSELPVSFFMPRGSYATSLLRELMKPRDLIRAGF